MPIKLSEIRKNISTIGIGKLSIKKLGISLILMIKVLTNRPTTTMIAKIINTLIKLLKTKEYKPVDL
jgi:hypothetical protein